MEKTVISFSVENWVTVLSMGAVGFIVIAVAVRLLHKFKPRD